MSVIPFDPNRRDGASADGSTADGSAADAGSGQPAPHAPPADDAAGALPPIPTGLPVGLGRPPARDGPRRGRPAMALPDAIRRIDLLEQTLIATLRENAGNWARAERAESVLAALERNRNSRG